MLATVKGDVHDIGKNLVDIILSNNGYEVVNLGIKQPISEIIRAADEHNADAIGMSGLLVKSTVVMKENLEELNSRELAARWPVLLGGAALTRAYVENDLAEVYEGQVRYARDAFDGLRLMDAVALAKASPDLNVADALPALRKRRVRQVAQDHDDAALRDTTRSDVATDNTIPTPPFWGTRVVKGIALADYAAYLDERATFLGQWGLKPAAAARTGRRTRSWWRPRATPGCGCGWTGSRPRTCSRRPSSTATSPATARATTSSCSARAGPRRRGGTSGCASPSPASVATGACAWPTSSRARNATRPTGSPTSSPSSS